MRNRNRGSESGFTLVELTIVVVISTITLIAVYQTLITQERAYRYQSAAIDAQGASRVALQVLAAEMRELSASAGEDPVNLGGSDLRIAERDSVQFRAFRKVGIACNVNVAGLELDVWVPSTDFAAGDTLMMFVEGNDQTDDDDSWATGIALTSAGGSLNEAACAAEWPDYDVQALRGLPTLTLQGMARGALIRSYNTLTYGAYRWDGEWVLGRHEAAGSVVPLVGPLLSPDSGGLVFRYFDRNGAELTPSTEAVRANVARIEITVRALSRGGPDRTNYVDSLTTNVYLRGN